MIFQHPYRLLWFHIKCNKRAGGCIVFMYCTLRVSVLCPLNLHPVACHCLHVLRLSTLVSDHALWLFPGELHNENNKQNKFCSMFKHFFKSNQGLPHLRILDKTEVHVRIDVFYRKHLCLLDLFLKLYMKYIYSFRFSFLILKLVRKTTLFVNLTVTTIYLEPSGVNSNDEVHHCCY